MKDEPKDLVIVFPNTIKLSNASERIGPYCQKVHVRAGAYYVERIKNPLNSILASWLVLKGTHIGMVESVLLRKEVDWVPIRSPVLLFGSDQYTLCRSDRKLPEEVLTFCVETMSKKPRKKPRSYVDQPD